jgi:cell division protein FtsB
MVVRRRLRTVLIPLALYGVSAAVVGYFLHNANIGSRGLLAKQALKIQIYEVNRELETAKAEHAEWNRRVALLKAAHVDRDLLEERARLLLGRVHRNDVIIIQP